MNKKIRDKIIQKMLDEITSGKRIDYTLINHIDPSTTTKEEMKYFLHHATNWFMTRHNYTKEQATNTLLANIKYIAVYFSKETSNNWHKYISSLGEQ